MDLEVASRPRERDGGGCMASGVLLGMGGWSCEQSVGSQRKGRGAVRWWRAGRNHVPFPGRRPLRQVSLGVEQGEASKPSVDGTRWFLLIPSCKFWGETHDLDDDGITHGKGTGWAAVRTSVGCCPE